MKSKVAISLLLVLNHSALVSMEEVEPWNCDFFHFFREILISVKFKCGQNAAADELFTAIQKENITQVATILQEHPRLADSAVDADGMTPLLAAAVIGNTSLMVQMLNRVPQPQVNRVANQGYALVRLKNSLHWQPLSGFTPLMAAAKWGHRDIAKQLLAAGAAKDLEDGSSPKKKAIDHAKEYGNIELVNLLQ